MHDPRRQEFPMSIVQSHTETVSEEAYRELALGDQGEHWELVRGRLWERPGMSVAHDRVTMDLVEHLLRQLDRNHNRVSAGLARLRVSADTYYVPDVAVIPTAMARRLGENPRALNAYAEPLPLVVEIWSPSTGKRDIGLKLPDYQARGDAEIWFIHLFERTLTAWRRTPDGTYVETVYRDGIVRPASLPHVAIDLEELFAA
jgi:Uma2 family endonuclease